MKKDLVIADHHSVSYFIKTDSWWTSITIVHIIITVLRYHSPQDIWKCASINISTGTSDIVCRSWR